MKVFQFSIFILMFILSGCMGFDLADIRGGLIKAKPDAPEITTERVDWQDYSEPVVEILPYEYDGCVLFYVKNELSCGECDRMDSVFDNQEVVSLLNNGPFIAIKATDDMEDWERALNRTYTKNTPTVSITSLKTLKPVFRHEETAIPTNAFIGILKEASVICRSQ